jgi:hypothetical protein
MPSVSFCFFILFPYLSFVAGCSRDDQDEATVEGALAAAPCGHLEASPTCPNQPLKPLSRLRGFDAAASILTDAMHAIGGTIKGLWKLQQGVGTDSPAVHSYERQTNKRKFDDTYLASKRE